MSAKFLSRLRAIIVVGGVLLAMIAAIGVAAWESQRGERMDIPLLEGGENDGVKGDAIPTPAAVGVAISVVAIAMGGVLGWLPCKCPSCGAHAVYPRKETSHMKLYRCGKCNEVDEQAPAEKRRKRRDMDRY